MHLFWFCVFSIRKFQSLDTFFYIMSAATTFVLVIVAVVVFCMCCYWCHRYAYTQSISHFSSSQKNQQLFTKYTTIIYRKNDDLTVSSIAAAPVVSTVKPKFIIANQYLQQIYAVLAIHHLLHHLLHPLIQYLLHPLIQQFIQLLNQLFFHPLIQHFIQ